MARAKDVWGDSLGENLHFAMSANLGEFFQLPLVHHKIIGCHDPLLEPFKSRILAHDLLELRAAKSFGKAGNQNDGAALFDHRQRAGKALHRLVPSGIERVTGT